MRLDLRGLEHLVGAGPFTYGDVPSFAGISGGRTSGLMAALLDPRVRLVFENTGREHRSAYDFLARLADALGRDITWLEWRPPPRVGDPPKKFGFAVVDYDTALKRSGELFEGLLYYLAEYRKTKPCRGRKVGPKQWSGCGGSACADCGGRGHLGPVVPHHQSRICTAYLKHRVQRAYMVSLGVEIDDPQTQYVGLRADEPDRVSRMRAAGTAARCYATPLADAGITKVDVGRFWSRQPFDLEVEHDRQGNCGACFEKDDADRSRVLGEEWCDAAWWIDIQRRYPGFGGRDKQSYEQLLKERPTRLAIEAALRDGREVVLEGDTAEMRKLTKADKSFEVLPDGGLGARRFKLVVLSERRYLEGERAAFSCACEASYEIGEESEDEEDAA